MAEHLPFKERVEGSNPSFLTFEYFVDTLFSDIRRTAYFIAKWALDTTEKIGHQAARFLSEQRAGFLGLMEYLAKMAFVENGEISACFLCMMLIADWVDNSRYTGV